MKISSTKNFKDGDRNSFSFHAVLKNVAVRQAKNGADFLVVDFADNSGFLSVTIFSDGSTYDDILESKIGTVFQVYATASFYQGKFSPRIDSVKKLSEEEAQKMLPELAEVSPENPEKMRQELAEIINEISEEPIKNTVLAALEEIGEDFYTSAAAVKMHHAYVYGLLEHSLKVARLVKNLAPLYPFIDKNMALAGAILHDVGKVWEYSQTLAVDRTRIGILQGHVVLGYRIVRKAAIKSKLDADSAERLEHIILSHQGELQWGAAVIAATPEAILVSLADNLDAKMGSCLSAISSASAEFTDFVPALQTKLLAEKRKVAEE